LDWVNAVAGSLIRIAAMLRQGSARQLEKTEVFRAGCRRCGNNRLTYGEIGCGCPLFTQLSRSRRVSRTAGVGHEDAFPTTTLSIRSRLGKPTVAGTRGNEQDAPIGVIRHCMGNRPGATKPVLPPHRVNFDRFVTPKRTEFWA